MAGIKMVDVAAQDPRTGEYNLKPVDKKGFVPQSCKWCFPMKFCMGKETTTMYQEEFKHLFELLFWAAKISQQEFNGWEPFNFANPADMAAIQKCVGLGGACKIKQFFVIVDTFY